jgi:hypothetical protein
MHNVQFYPICDLATTETGYRQGQISNSPENRNYGDDFTAAASRLDAGKQCRVRTRLRPP